MIGLTAVTALVAVLTFVFDYTNSGGGGKVTEPVTPLVKPKHDKLWPAGSVEEQVARQVLHAAEAARCPAGTVRLIEAAISILPPSAQTGDLPLAKAHAVIELPSGADPATITETENGQGATPEIARSEALSRLLTKVTSRLNADLAC